MSWCQRSTLEGHEGKAYIPVDGGVEMMTRFVDKERVDGDTVCHQVLMISDISPG